MPDRDLDITKFSFIAYRKLKKTLGEFDAVVECNEIAINEFLEQAKKEDIRKYIQQLSTKHKVKVDEVDFLKLSSRIRQYYVASVFQQAEQFLKDFKEEWIKYFPDKTWIEPLKGETKIQSTLKSISLTLTTDLIDIYEYYRIVRNYMSHTDRDIEELKIRYKKVHANQNKFLRDLDLSVLPNKIDEVDFSDFLILTNIVKHIAYLISTTSKPDNERIAQILYDKSKEDKGKAYKGLKKLKNDSKRYETAIKSFITSNFGRFSARDISEVHKKFENLLA
ncbi:MAG: hypothetical protein K8R53_06510 [Bacteroidales bacterium]|nr:hypothetical protein [Bacteroidales bacterium]